MLDQSRLYALMQEKGLDAVVAASPTNVLYSTGAYIMTQKVFRDRLALAVFSLDHDPVFLVCNIEETLAVAESRIPDVRSYVEFKEHPIDKLAALLKSHKLGGKRVGVELGYLTYRQADRLIRACPDIEFVSCEDVFTRLRQIKTPDEIDLLRRAASGTHRAIEAALRASSIGETEKALADRVVMNILREGATEPAFIVLSSGDRTVQAHPTAGSKPLQIGDVVRLDAGGLHHGYYSDEAYTALVGDVSPHRYSMLQRVKEVHREVIMAARPGVRAKDLFNLCVNLCEKHKLPFTAPHIGHSMGIELHEEPMINPQNDFELLPNMVLNMEPIIIDHADGAGYHVEDLILITEGEPEVLTGSDLSTDPLVIR